ncbi:MULTISPECIES: CopG family antitoxin [Halomonadaceae]|uniref:Uncharacterized protein n=2 Tax=Vreelandella TaxID=3137766 RepID=A0A7Z0LSD9_9GAMM|nr:MULTISPECIES: CopG family antitoxin [Halomonas]NYS77719.1 hypothetical protein [Halomonas glaciei]
MAYIYRVALAGNREFWEAHDFSDYLDGSQVKPASLPKLKPSTAKDSGAS